MEDIELINNVKNNNCSESLSELINRHAGVCDVISKKYSGLANSSGVAFHDFFENHKFVIYEATKDFDEKYGVKFVTWVANKMKFFCLNTLNKEKRNEYLNENILNSLSYNNKEENSDLDTDVKNILNIINDIQDDKLKKVFYYRFFSESKEQRKWKNISKKIGISVQWSIHLYKKGKKIIKEKLKNNKKYI